MSAVTLETLRADYEATQKAYADFVNDMRLQRLPGYVYLKELDDLYMKQEVCSDLYFIAKQYGTSAAVLFKLSDGAIDPRISEVR